MAHLIDLSNYRENMAYVGKTPWHGLGQQLTEGAPIEIWASEAGMDFHINQSPVLFDQGSVPDRVVLWRDDTKAALSVVSDRFQIVQPLEVLEFFRDLVASTGDYQLETAGSLDGGRKYWALAKYKENLNFAGDIVKPYLLLATAADGTMATTGQHTSTRVVCHNTLQMSLRADSKSAIKIRHSTAFHGERVKRDLGVIQVIADYKSDIETLINKAITREQAVEIYVELIGKRDTSGNLTNEKAVKRVAGEIMTSLINGPGANLETAHGTAWGALNAVTHYVDFKARAHNQDNRFSSGQFGSGAELKKSAFKALLVA